MSEASVGDLIGRCSMGHPRDRPARTVGAMLKQRYDAKILCQIRVLRLKSECITMGTSTVPLRSYA